MGLPELSEALGLGRDPSLILRPLEHLYRALDQDLAARAAGRDLPCHQGCDACCHEAVFLSAPEVLLVMAHLLESRTLDQLTRLVEQMVHLSQRFADELELLEELAPGAERDEVAARVAFRCPLLGDDGGCTIYPVRELNARTFGQSWDPQRDEAYGCGLTHQRLRVLPDQGRTLYDAREARRRLVAAVPGTERVHVYPWWFARYGALLLAAKSESSART